MTYIKNLNINLFGGKFNQILSFKPNLNILSGINGTGKTKVLQLLKQGQNVTLDLPQIQFGNLKIIALSPKRNAEKRAMVNLVSIIRNTNLPQKTQELIGKQIRDESYDSYPSFAELLLLKFEKLRSQNFDLQVQQQVLNNFIIDVNEKVIDLVLPGYKLNGRWNKETQSLDVDIFKDSAEDSLSLENLSTGEQELLSLSFNIYLTKDDIDVYLIDEPEIHLNWTLERNLFDFLKKFSETNNKQVIVTTHSRIIFDPELQEFVTYLMWEKGVIKAKQQVPKEYKEKIAGESMQLMNILTPTKKTIFVEDAEHEITIKTLLKIYQKDENSVEILSLGSSGTIENLYGALHSQSRFSNAWFLRDGDNQSMPPRDRFIKLKKYSIESYYFNPNVLKNLFGTEQGVITDKLIESIKNNSPKITGNSKNTPFIKELINQLTTTSFKLEWLDVMDCSGIIDDFVRSLNLGLKKDFLEQYLKKAFELGLIEEIFDNEFVSFIKAA